MGEGFKHGGTAKLLNFRVVGGTATPTAPKENTIWINTDQAITSHYFSATEPEGMEEGSVWISTGKSSNVAFSITKKNPVMVYPISAKQYVNGAWVDKEAKSYQNGEWVDWVQYLYNKGNEYEDVTGGWIERSVAKITRARNYLEVVNTDPDYHAFISTGTVINLTDVKRIEVDYSFVSTNETSGLFLQNGSVPSSGGTAWSAQVAKVFLENTGNLGTYKTAVLDTAAIAGTYLIYYMAYGTSRIESIRTYT